MTTPTGQERPADGAGEPIRKLVVAVEIPEPFVADLRQRFPDIAIVQVSSDELTPELADADALCSFRLTPEQIAQAPRLRWLQTMSAGVEHVLTPELVDRGIALTNASGVHAINIGEHLLAMMLAFARGLPGLVRAQGRREWRGQDRRDQVFELHGQTLLLVGLGDIALALAERVSGLGMRVVGARRRADQPPPPHVDEVVGLDHLGDAVSRADHVAICLPLTDATRGLFDARLLGRMRPTAYLYNIGRGAIVDQAALIAALEEGRLAGAGLDVTDPEPLPAESALWGMDNVLITSHTSGATPHYWERAVPILADNIARFQDGRPLLNRVDPSRGY